MSAVITLSPTPWTVDKTSFPITIIDANGFIVGEFHCADDLDGEAAIANESQTIRDAVLAGTAPDLLAALSELVATKDLHDQLEILKPLDSVREQEYRMRRVAAWNAARAGHREGDSMSGTLTKEQIQAESARIIAKCKRLAVDHRASDKEKFQAVQAAYEIGIAEGRVLGTIETADKTMSSLGAAIAKATS